MKCRQCNHELTWIADHDIEDNPNWDKFEMYQIYEAEKYCMVTSLSCSNCKCDVAFYYPKGFFNNQEEK